MIHVTILNPKETIYAGAAASVVLPGDTGDFEVLEFHKAAIGMLRAGEILLDGAKSVKIRAGVVRFHRNELVALVEQ